ncbi:hypothetical protein KGM_203873 [Danaus plexippus plexippus]|uniref:Uncharacterized protein n=1 Tax=Danaus plexippus plexippus TaxID=278856 RepID=A0A212FN39_DANPL|nr:hypothetical protein KGM_203873 [Danaus plexippus plexippus]
MTARSRSRNSAALNLANGSGLLPVNRRLHCLSSGTLNCGSWSSSSSATAIALAT